MRVQNVKSTQAAQAQKVSGKNQTEYAKFTELMEEKHEDARRDDLKKMMDKIKKQGEELVDSKNIDLLVNYKRMIKEFVSNAVDFAFEIQDKKGTSRIGRSKILKIVSQIDKELVDITQDFLREERNKINMLAKIGELNGMLMNIFV